MAATNVADRSQSQGSGAELPACDLCYTRKVKCDRQDPCMNCVDAQSACRRTRPKRVSTRKLTPLAGLEARLATLENTTASLQQSNVQSNKSSDESHRERSVGSGSLNDSTTSVGDGSSIQPLKKRKLMSPERQVPLSKVTNCPPTHYAGEARDVINEELGSNLRIPPSRRAVLESALELVNRFPNNPHTQPESKGYGKPQEEIAPVATLLPELMYMMLTESYKHTIWPDHITWKTLKHMCTTVLDGSASNDILLHYTICIYVKAIQYTYRWPSSGLDNSLQKYVAKSKNDYEGAALSALKTLKFLTRPSLSLLQALLSAAQLMQMLGAIPHASQLTTYASQVLISLGYHSLEDSSPREDLSEKHLCICECYMLDKFFSTVLFRPQSLPKLNFRPSTVFRHDMSMMLYPISLTLLELAEVLEGLSSAVSNQSTAMDGGQIQMPFQSLEEQMYDIHARIDKRKSLVPPHENLECDWLGIDSMYYTILTQIFQSNPCVKRDSVRLRCLDLARLSLRTLSSLQAKVTPRTDFVDAYPSFIYWTMLICPLSPFFIVFCNVVATSNIEDFQLMKAISNSLSTFTKSYPALEKLTLLLRSFIDVCQPLIDEAEKNVQDWLSSSKPSGKNNSTMTNTSTSRTTQRQNIRPSSISSILDPETQQAQLQAPVDFHGIGDGSNMEIESSETDQSMWNDRLMWELFDNQPSMTWLENDLESLINM